VDSVYSVLTYNGDGLRMIRTVAGQGTANYVWDVAAGLPVVLQDGTNAGACPERSRRVYGLDLISRTDSGGDQEYYLTDGLGSTTELTDGAGSVTGTYSYDVFGAVRAHSGAATEWSFTGEQVDGATGLQYLRARYYDPAIGRFLSRDSLEGC
jgi:uncharacterized protein RhaS with RHS repeats